MSATEPLCHLIGINPAKLTQKESLILEAELFVRLCDELKVGFKAKYEDYFQVMKYTTEKENAIMEASFIRCVINDILSTKEYTLDGIAYYTHTPEEVIYELAMGHNTSPSAMLLRKIIELHRSVRRDLYDAIIKKILSIIFDEKK